MGYVREDVILDFKMPTILKNTIADVEEASMGEDTGYDNWVDTLDYLCKELYVEGAITKEQWDLVMKRFPFPYI